MGIPVFDFLCMFLEKDAIHVKIFGLDTNEVVFDGFFQDMPPEFKRKEVLSVDNPFMANQDFLTINV